jgi:hypothetical protein
MLDHFNGGYVFQLNVQTWTLGALHKWFFGIEYVVEDKITIDIGNSIDLNFPEADVNLTVSTGATQY